MDIVHSPPRPSSLLPYQTTMVRDISTSPSAWDPSAQQLANSAEVELATRLGDSLTLNSHNRQIVNNYWPAGTHPTIIQLCNEQVIPKSNTALASIPESSALRSESGSNHPTGIPGGHMDAPGSALRAKSKMDSRPPSIFSKALSRKSTKTVIGPEQYLHIVTQKDMEFPESLPDYIQTYTRTLSRTLAYSPRTICLWSPYPNQRLPKNLQEKYCTLGDVGMFDSEGNFEVLFNIFMSEEENLQMYYCPPKGFQPLLTSNYEDAKPVVEDVTQFATQDFHKHKIKDEQTGQYSFIFQSMQKPEKPGGAILALPEGYTRTTILNSVIREINDYLQEHIESWYATTNHWNTDNNLPNDSLKLIFSCYKSRIWGAGVLPRNQYQTAIPAIKMERLSLDDSYRWNAPEAPIRINHGSTKRNAKDIWYTIAIEVMSVHRPNSSSIAPKNSFLDSILSLRNRKTNSRLSITERIAKPVGKRRFISL